MDLIYLQQPTTRDHLERKDLSFYLSLKKKKKKLFGPLKMTIDVDNGSILNFIFLMVMILIFQIKIYYFYQPRVKVSI